MLAGRKTVSELFASDTQGGFIPSGDRADFETHIWPKGEPSADSTHYDALISRPGRKKLMVGFGGFNGLHLAASLKADALLMLDANPFQQEIYKELIFPLLKECGTAQEFNAAYAAHVRGKGDHSYLANNDPAHPKEWQVRGGADRGRYYNYMFTQDEKLYAKLHQMANDGELAAANLNLFDTDKCRAIGSTLADNGYDVGAIYSSNIGAMVRFFKVSGDALQNEHKPRNMYVWPKDAGDEKHFDKNAYLKMLESLFLISDERRFRHFHADFGHGEVITEAIRAPQILKPTIDYRGV